MRKILTCLAGLIAAAGPAKADWLDRAWSDESVQANGDPAVTLGADGVVLVLPEATLREAHAAGVDTKEAVRLFLGRWGQRCSDVVDLDQGRKNVRVRLFLQNPVSLEDASEAVQGEILDTLLAQKQAAAKPFDKRSGAKKAARTKLLPRVESLFVVSEDHVDFVIDYIPEGKGACVAPGAGDEVS